MDYIHIGSVTVPLIDFAVGANAILGIRNSGKTVTGKGTAEQLLDHNIPIVVFDAVGKWRWMKVPGKSNCAKGYKVVVAGGHAPDLPLTPQSVPAIVRAALKDRIPLIIDLFDKNLSKADWRRIVQSAIRIIHYENEGGPIHVYLEEAPEYVPQKVIDGETYAEVEKMVRMGGNNSVGITLIGQRSQEINKAVLDNCSNLILGCQIGNKAIEAISTWVDRLDAATANEVTTSLPGLQAGEHWVWTRQNPGRPHRVQIPMCRSFHPDRRTPEVVLKAAKPTDIAEFVSTMTKSIPKVIEEAKANDPVALKQEITKLKRELHQKAGLQTRPVTAVKTELKIQKVPVFDKRTASALTTLHKSLEKLFPNLTGIGEQCRSVQSLLTQASKNVIVANVVASQPKAPPFMKPILTPVMVHTPKVTDNGEPLNKCERNIVSALIQHGPSDIRRLATMSGYRISGGFRNAVSHLRVLGFITRSDIMDVTDSGRSAVPTPDLPVGQALIDHWLSQLDKCEKAILVKLIEIYPEGLELSHIAEATGYQVSGGFRNAVSYLRTSNLIEGKGVMRAAPHLMG